MESQQFTRREFVKIATVATTSAVAVESSIAEETLEANSPKIDTHLHCFAGTESQKFPYHANAPYRPTALATPEHLLSCMDAAGVDYAVVVHPEPYQDDHRYLKHCIDRGRGRLKGTILLFSDRPGSLEKMPELCKQMDVIAVRVHAYAPDRLPPFGSKELRRLWKMATDLNLAVQLHFEPRYADGFESLIKEFSETTVFIDHMGRPFQGTPREHARVIKWSRFPNTIMKLSSIPTTRQYPHRDIQPTIRKLTNAFGAERMMYGGGFGAAATGESYKQAFSRARSLLSHLSEKEQNQILGGTAKKVLRFG